VKGLLDGSDALVGGKISHVGQVSFDRSLITQVELTEPCASNSQKLELNCEDIFLAEAAASMDPVMEYVLLGGCVEEGIMAWITLGVDAQAEHSVTSASTWTAHGGVANPEAGRVVEGLEGLDCLYQVLFSFLAVRFWGLVSFLWFLQFTLDWYGKVLFCMYGS
jgi:hypothetical protein